MASLTADDRFDVAASSSPTHEKEKHMCHRIYPKAPPEMIALGRVETQSTD